MTKLDDGGPAFPQTCLNDPCHPASIPGMSLRDWFASQADQPGEAEIASAAGLFYGSGAVWSGPHDRIADFQGWWREKTNEQRFALCAAIRYAYADAMLTARKKGSSDE